LRTPAFEDSAAHMLHAGTEDAVAHSHFSRGSRGMSLHAEPRDLRERAACPATRMCGGASDRGTYSRAAPLALFVAQSLEDLPRAVAALRQGKAVKVVVDLKASS
jgi:hypothetical protein